jgi:hypothetical protein
VGQVVVGGGADLAAVGAVVGEGVAQAHHGVAADRVQRERRPHHGVTLGGGTAQRPPPRRVAPP